QTATRAPWARNDWAMPLPMPLEPPITSTCRPEKSSAFISLPPVVVCLTCVRIGASVVNGATQRAFFAGRNMQSYKQLSRSVKNLTVLVTGAASGMGRATARLFADEGVQVEIGRAWCGGRV